MVLSLFPGEIFFSFSEAKLNGHLMSLDPSGRKLNAIKTSGCSSEIISTVKLVSVFHHLSISISCSNQLLIFRRVHKNWEPLLEVYLQSSKKPITVNRNAAAEVRASLHRKDKIKTAVYNKIGLQGKLRWEITEQSMFRLLQ